MRPRLPPLLGPFLCLAALLLGLAAAGSLGAHHPPPGDSATHPLVALSLFHDRDLVWDERDHARAYRLWNAGPDGLALTEGRDGTLRYARPLAYPLALLPFLPLGPSGPAVLNTFLLLAMLVTTLWVYTTRFAPPDGSVLSSADPLTSSAARPLGEGLPPRPGTEATEDRSRVGGSPSPGWLLLVFAGGSFLLSYTLAHAWRSEPTLLEAAGIFIPMAVTLALERGGRSRSRRRDIVLALAAGLLLGAALTSAPPLIVLAAAPAVVLALTRRWRALSALALGTVLAAGLLAAAEHRLAGRWSAWQPGVEHLTFRDAFPGDRATGPDAAVEPPPAPRPVRSPSRLARESWWLLAGRHGGALPYFPFAALAVAICLAGPVDRARLLLLAATLALAAWMLLAPPDFLTGGDLFTGRRWLAVLAPALALLPSPAVFRRRATEPAAARRTAARLAAWGTATAVLAAAVWTVPALAAALAGTIASAAAPGAGAGAATTAHLRLASFRALPLELSLLPRLPGYRLRGWGRGTWAFPLATVHAAEDHPHGVWLRGGAEAELLLASPEPLGAVTFTAFSPLPGNVLTADGGGGEEVVVRFDSPGKRAGVEVTLPVVPAVRGLGFFPSAPDDVLYRVTMTTTEGWIPGRRDPGSVDPRHLSTFLSFTGEAP